MTQSALTLPNLEDVRAARERIGGTIRRTPLLDDHRLSGALGCAVTVKAEHLQRTASFKFRGIYNRVAAMSPAEREPGIVTCSSGNAAQAAAMAAYLHGVSCTVATFDNVVETKMEAVRALGAEVIKCGLTADELTVAALDIAERRGLSFVHPYDDPHVIAGHGSLALEVLEDAAEIDAILLPTSGGGLLAGTAMVVKALRPQIKVYGVQPEGAAGIALSYEAGAIVGVEQPQTIADGLRAQRPGDYNFPLIHKYCDGILRVKEDSILPTMALAWRSLRIAIEPSAAVGLAALAPGSQFEGQRVVVVTTGANLDLNLLRHALDGGSIQQWNAISGT